MVIPPYLGFNLFFHDSGHFGAMTYGYCRFGAACGCRRLGVMCGCHCLGVAFISMRVIQMRKIYLINDRKSNQWSSICCRIGVICILITIIILNM